MLYRTVPKTGDKLSILGFGCMRLPSTRTGGVDEARAIRQIRTRSMAVSIISTQRLSITSGRASRCWAGRLPAATGKESGLPRNSPTGPCTNVPTWTVSLVRSRRPCRPTISTTTCSIVWARAVLKSFVVLVSLNSSMPQRETGGSGTPASRSTIISQPLRRLLMPMTGSSARSRQLPR